MNKEKQSLILAILILFVIFVIFCNPVAIVGVGQRGVKLRLDGFRLKVIRKGFIS